MLRLFTANFLILLLSKGALASGSQPNADGEVFGDFKDLHGPFVGSAFSEFSPLQGLNLDLIWAYRSQGHVGPVNRHFIRPLCRSLDPGIFPQRAYPQDPTASVLERLFPSQVGLVINHNNKDKINTFLKPKNIALIFNLISTPGFYEKARDEAEELLVSALQPDDYKKRNNKLRNVMLSEKYDAQRMQNTLHRQAYGDTLKVAEYKREFKSKHGDSYRFADLLYRALHETVGAKAAENGYPPHIVERILLTFMWEKKKSKSALKPFYDTLRADIIDKEKAKNINWQNYYTAEDYWSAKQINDPNDFDMQALLKYGYPFFEDRFPPVILYSVAQIMVDGKLTSYSDCGDTSLRNILLHFLYSFGLNRYEWERLEQLKSSGFAVQQKLIDYIRYICPHPCKTKTREARNGWGQMLFDILEKTKDETLKPKLLHPSRANGRYGIDAGVDNMMVLLNLLLGDPKWGQKFIAQGGVPNKMDKMKSSGLRIRENMDLQKDPRKALRTMLDRACYIFSCSDLVWDWEVSLNSNEKINEFEDLEIKKDINDPKDVVLTFKNRNLNIFQWAFQPNHFDFYRCAN